jgi:hypothetical protein
VKEFRSGLDGHRTIFFHGPKLFRALRTAHADGSLPTLLKRLARASLLIVDDLGTAATKRMISLRSSSRLWSGDYPCSWLEQAEESCLGFRAGKDRDCGDDPGFGATLLEGSRGVLPFPRAKVAGLNRNWCPLSSEYA